MSALVPLYSLIGNISHKLSKEEYLLLEAHLFVHLCNELKEIFKIQYKAYFRLMKFTKEMEDVMLEDNFARYIIDDILSTKEYTLPGIAYYTQTPEDVVYEVATGRNTNPTARFLRKVIEIHRAIRRELYAALLKKITPKSDPDPKQT